MPRSSAPTIVFAHGAGASSASAWMQLWAERLATLGRVTTFDYAYMAAGKKLPDRMPALVATHLAAIAKATVRRKSAPLVLAGKSMGSRVGCHVTIEPDAPKVAALVCFGYPLQSPAGTLRDEVLRALTTPILFVQGTRDELCPLPMLASVRADMTAPNELHVVEGGDHSLAVKGGRAAQEAADAAILDVVATFLARHV